MPAFRTASATDDDDVDMSTIKTPNTPDTASTEPTSTMARPGLVPRIAVLLAVVGLTAAGAVALAAGLVVVAILFVVGAIIHVLSRIAGVGRRRSDHTGSPFDDVRFIDLRAAPRSDPRLN